MVCREILPVCCHNHTERVSTPCVQKIAVFCVYVKESGRYGCHSPVGGKESGFTDTSWIYIALDSSPVEFCYELPASMECGQNFWPAFNISSLSREIFVWLVTCYGMRPDPLWCHRNIWGLKMKVNTNNNHACAKARTDCPHVFCSEVVLSPAMHHALGGCVHNSSGCVSRHSTQAVFSPANLHNTDTPQIYTVVFRQARHQVAIDHMYMWWTSIYRRRETRCNPTP